MGSSSSDTDADSLADWHHDGRTNDPKSGARPRFRQVALLPCSLVEKMVACEKYC